MKKFLSVSLLLTAMFFVGCGEEDQTPKEDTLEGTFEISGSFRLYQRSPQNYWQDDKKGKVCFYFPQLMSGGNKQFAEAAGSREEFCFSNSGDAKNLLKTPYEGLRGSATVVVKDVTKRDILVSKDDPCVKTKTCLYNEAVLVEVKEIETALDWKERRAQQKEEREKREAEVNEESAPSDVVE